MEKNEITTAFPCESSRNTFTGKLGLSVSRLVKTIHCYMKQLHNHFLPSKKFNNSQIQNISYCSLSKANYQLAYFDALEFIRNC